MPPGADTHPPPPGADTPGADMPPPPRADMPPRADTPRSRHAPVGADTPPPPEQTPPRRACWEIRSTRGRYASYWNAYLFKQ